MSVSEALKPLELTTTLFGVLSVYLSVSRRWMTWPTGIVNVVLSAWLFFRTGLYSDAALQLVYFVLSIYGWVKWSRGSPIGVVDVSEVSARGRLGFLLVGVGLWLCLGGVASRLPGSALPYLDAALTAGSIVAEVMMARKLVDTWVLWIILDVVYVGMFSYKGLFALAVNYAVYLILAELGRRNWNTELHRQADTGHA